MKTYLSHIRIHTWFLTIISFSHRRNFCIYFSINVTFVLQYRDWTQGLMLAGQALYHLSYTLSLCVCVWGGGDWGLNSWLHTCKTVALPLEPCLQSILSWLFLGDGVLQTISPGWPWTLILLISASQKPRIRCEPSVLTPPALLCCCCFYFLR
jgi:hypothetical protein